MGIVFPMGINHLVIRTADVVLGVWVVIWTGIALLIGFEIHDLTRISDSLIDSSAVLEETSSLISSLRDLPVVGERVENVEREIREAASGVRASGEASRRNIVALSLLLGVTIALLPTVPLLAIYVPLRVAWQRDVRAVSRALTNAGDDAGFREYLARRAVERLPLHRLVEIVDDPWGRLQRGDYEALSHAELDRLGLASQPAASASS
ncbi:MAG TPA: hypothetical protein VFF07_16545 [Actinomycetota bacterium]|nr:hypothetical protein [Actinomycetota bacterium]